MICIKNNHMITQQFFTLVRWLLLVVNDNKLHYGHTHHTRDIIALLHGATDN
jgi:hypothetical protein